MPAPTPPDAPDTEIIIWRPRLVAVMIDLLDDAWANDPFGHRWSIPPWRRAQLGQVLLEVLDRHRNGWIITEVSIALLDETRTLRAEAYRRLRDE